MGGNGIEENKNGRGKKNITERGALGRIDRSKINW
jgi:hypothetical protein